MLRTMTVRTPTVKCHLSVEVAGGERRIEISLAHAAGLRNFLNRVAPTAPVPYACAVYLVLADALAYGRAQPERWYAEQLKWSRARVRRLLAQLEL